MGTESKTTLKNYIVERGKNLWTKNIETLSEYMNKAALYEQQPKQMISIWSEDSVQPRSRGELLKYGIRCLD